MAEEYFKNFPLVNYNGKISRNIILRSKFITEVMGNIYAFYPHVILDGQTPEQIAYDYYGSADLDWLVWFSNQSIDPYYDWPMVQDQLDIYINKKYGSFEEAVETIHHYTFKKSVESDEPNQYYTDGYEMTPTTYSFLTVIEKSYWTPVSCYDYEFALNESKRTIQLLDARLKDQVLKEISEIMK
jgi:hypothetical protein